MVAVLLVTRNWEPSTASPELSELNTLRRVWSFLSTPILRAVPLFSNLTSRVSFWNSCTETPLFFCGSCCWMRFTSRSMRASSALALVAVEVLEVVAMMSPRYAETRMTGAPPVAAWWREAAGAPQPEPAGQIFPPGLRRWRD